MGNPQKRKGDKAEREVAELINQMLGTYARRKLGAGRQDDEGDIEGVTDWTIEVKNYSNVSVAVSKGRDDAVREQANAGTPFGCAFVRHPGGTYSVVMSPEQWATVVRELAA